MKAELGLQYLLLLVLHSLTCKYFIPQGYDMGIFCLVHNQCPSQFAVRSFISDKGCNTLRADQVQLVLNLCCKHIQHALAADLSTEKHSQVIGCAQTSICICIPAK